MGKNNSCYDRICPFSACILRFSISFIISLIFCCHGLGPCPTPCGVCTVHIVVSDFHWGGWETKHLLPLLSRGIQPTHCGHFSQAHLFSRKQGIWFLQKLKHNPITQHIDQLLIDIAVKDNKQIYTYFPNPVQHMGVTSRIFPHGRKYPLSSAWFSGCE